MTTWVQQRPVAVFAVLAVGCTWGVWLPRALHDQDLIRAAWAVDLGAVWTYGPAAAAVLAAGLTRGRGGIAELGRRLTRWRVGWSLWVLALLGPAAPWLAVTVLAPTGLDVPATSAAGVGLAGALPLLLVLALTDGIGEEAGWRGFALPRLLDRTGPLQATLLIGALTTVWHLPLLATDTAVLHGVPVVLLAAEVTVTAVLHTWLFLRSGGSALLAVALHASGNLLGLPLPSPDEPATAYLVTLGLEAAIAAVAARDLVSRSRPSPRPVQPPSSAATP